MIFLISDVSMSGFNNLFLNIYLHEPIKSFAFMSLNNSWNENKNTFSHSLALAEKKSFSP